MVLFAFTIEGSRRIAKSRPVCVSESYRPFQVTFYYNIPNFVATFVCSLQSSKVHFRICKPVCKCNGPRFPITHKLFQLESTLFVMISLYLYSGKIGVYSDSTLFT